METDLVRRAQDGDEQAFASLAVSAGNRLHAVASWPEWTSDGRIRFRGGGPNQFWLMDADGENPQMLVDLSSAFAAIDPPGRVNNIRVPGDPGRTFHWQPGG